MKRIIPALILGLALGLPAWADMNHMNQMGHPMVETNMMARWVLLIFLTMLSEGMVRKINKDQAKLALQHGSLGSLGMPAMTMIFRISDPAFLDRVKPDDHIRFQADQVNGLLTVTQIEVVQ